MKPWTERPLEVASLLNPAFCGFLLYTAVRSYQEEAGEGMPLALCALVLPLVLHKDTREGLPRTVATTLVSWLGRHQEALVDLPPRVASVLPYTREALLFAAMRDLLRGARGGAFEIGPGRVSSATRLTGASEEVRNCVNKAQFLGRWLAQAGDPSIVYQSFGIQP